MALSKQRTDELSAMCSRFRRSVLKSIHAVQSGHAGGSLSVCEILTLLYQERMNLNDVNSPERDRLVLSKGHAAPMMYINLIEKGFLPEDSMNTLRRTNSILQGHPSNSTPGVEMPSGPLGLGLSAGQGMALALSLDGSASRVYVVMGDGELNEGAVWEAAMSAPKFKLCSLTAIIDHNKVQLDGTTDEVMPLGDLTAKWQAFGWNVLRCDGHDFNELSDALDKAEAYKEGPTVIIADTIKGKGVSFMEGKAAWHGKPLGDEDLKLALEELGGDL